MSKLLLDDKPLIVLPSLAKRIGLNESIVLQQLHYWLKDSHNVKEGFTWVYNTYEDWQNQFPFWSVSTIRRTITKLEKEGFVVVGNYNKLKIDNTKWYRINYSSLDMNRPPVQNEQTECSKWTDGQFKMDRPLPEITTENTSDKTTTTIEIQNPVIHFEKMLCRLSPRQTESLYQWVDDFHGQAEIIIEAIDIADNKNKRYFGFVEFLLKEWSNSKLDSLDRVKAYEQEKFNKQKQPKIGRGVNVGKVEAAEQFARENGIPF